MEKKHKVWEVVWKDEYVKVLMYLEATEPKKYVLYYRIGEVNVISGNMNCNSVVNSIS